MRSAKHKAPASPLRLAVAIVLSLSLAAMTPAEVAVHAERGGVPNWVPEGLETAYRATQLTINDTEAMSVVVADQAFGGTFIDDEGLHIAIADDRVDRQSIPLLFSEPDLVRVESAQWTFDTLRAVEDRVVEAWTGGNDSLRTLSYVRMDEQQNRVDIGVASNTSAVTEWAEVHIPSGTYRVVQAEPLRLEPPTRTMSGQASSNEEAALDGAASWAEHQVLGFADCANRGKCTPARSNIDLFLGHSNGVYQCTTAFKAIDRQTSDIGYLTNGHCNGLGLKRGSALDGNSSYAIGSYEFGKMTIRQYQNVNTPLVDDAFVDAGFVRLSSPTPDAEAWVYFRDGRYNDERVKSVSRTYRTFLGFTKEAPEKGSVICYAGMGRDREQAAAHTCGSVGARVSGQDANGLIIKRVVCFDFDAYDGDSGAGMFNGGTAMAIMAFRSSSDTCPSAGIPIVRVEEALDVAVVLSGSAYDVHAVAEAIQ